MTQGISTETREGMMGVKSIPCLSSHILVTCILFLATIFFTMPAWAVTPKIAAGGTHTAAIKSDGTLWAWGSGEGTVETYATLPVQKGTGTAWTQIAAGGAHTLALKSDGTLWAWGSNDFGQLGDGTTVYRRLPVQIGNDTWSQVTAGFFDSFALKSDGTLWAWGYNKLGQLGDGTTTQRNSPAQIGVDTNWSQIAAGGGHTVALKNDGTLWAWGYNWFGQLGDGTKFDKTLPVQIGTDTGWIQIAAGENHTLALKSDGTLWAWGNNWFGQLGDGTAVDKTSPMQIGTDADWSQIAAGVTSHSLALKSDNTLWAWGRNWFGQLGDGTDISKTLPVQIGTDAAWSQIAPGYAYTVALKSDGTLWAWGWNYYGQLGDGTTADKNMPEFITNVIVPIKYFTITGKVTHRHDSGVSGVKVSVAENPQIEAITDQNGNYILSVPAGTYTIIPSRDSSDRFTPKYRNVSVSSADVAGMDFRLRGK